MQSTFIRLKYIFLGLFFFAAAGSAYYQIWILKPRQDCERKGGWWDGDERVCGTPIDLSLFTGRPTRPRSAAAPSRPGAQAVRPPATTRTAPAAPAQGAPTQAAPVQAASAQP